MLETAIAIVEIISPSSEFAFTSAFSIASSAQGSFKFEILPVTNDKYAPPAPSIGIYVNISIIPTAQYIGSTESKALANAFHSGVTSKIKQSAKGNAKMSTNKV